MSERQCLNHNRPWGTCEVVDQRECRSDGPIEVPDALRQTLLERVEERRKDDEFMGRLAASVERNREILDKLAAGD